MTTEIKIWIFLRGHGLTAAGAGALMGHMHAESGSIPNRVEMLCLKRLSEAGQKYNDATYTAAVDSGKITREEFLHPLPGKQYGYGIVQWTSPSRKAGLYDRAKEKGCSIGDLDLQLSYLIWELKTCYPAVLKVLKSAQTVKEASDIVLLKFECPADCGEAVKATRAKYGQAIYDRQKEREESDMGIIANDAINVMRSWIGLSRAKGTHKPIIDLYNSHKPLARGYQMSYSDSYCDATVSAAFIKLGAVSLIGGTECGVEEHIKLFKAAGIWNEDGTIIPDPGDIICYNWDDATQPNDGYADHIGIVEKVEGKTITVIEGNLNGNVGRRAIKVGWGYIRGYAKPKYATEAPNTSEESELKKEVKTCKVKLQILVKGSKGEQVKTIQRLLVQMGYKGADGKALSVDGDFGTNTEYALTQFQKAKNFKPAAGYGTCAAGTWKRLLGVKSI